MAHPQVPRHPIGQRPLHIRVSVQAVDRPADRHRRQEATEVDRALAAHELIKVKILGDDRDEREAIGNALCAGTDAAPVQRVGKVLVLWRPKPEDAK